MLLGIKKNFQGLALHSSVNLNKNTYRQEIHIHIPDVIPDFVGRRVLGPKAPAQNGAAYPESIRTAALRQSNNLDLDPKRFL